MRALMTRSVRARSSAGPRAFHAVPCHIIHFAVETCGEPFGETGFGAGKIDVGDAHRLEAEFAPPRLMLRASWV